MICTGKYEDFKNLNYRTISISEDRGKQIGYKGLAFPELASTKEIHKSWHNRASEIDEKDNNLLYIKEYYEQVLLQLNPKEIYKKLDNRVLLCYEDNNDFCHRHIVAAWLELSLDIEIKEVTVKNKKIVETTKPEYIKEELAKIIKLDNNYKKRKRLILSRCNSFFTRNSKK